MNNQESDVSVVIPVRNRPAVIQRAIESALTQTYPVREVVVVDDGSTDETPQVIERLADANPPIRLLRQPEARGAPAARNRGAQNSSGTFIAFLDSDDVWLPTHVESLRALLKAQPEAPAAFSNYLIEYRGRPTKVTRIPARVTLDMLLKRNAIGGSSLVLVRRTAFEAIGGFRDPMPSCQDWDLWLRLAELGDLPVEPKPQVRYFFDGSDRISKNPERVFAGHRIIFGHIESLIADRADAKRVRAEHQLRLAEINSRHTFRPARAITHAMKALQLDPSAKRLIDVPKVMLVLALYHLT